MVGDKARELNSRQVVKRTHSKNYETDSLIISPRRVSGSSLKNMFY